METEEHNKVVREATFFVAGDRSFAELMTLTESLVTVLLTVAAIRLPGPKEPLLDALYAGVQGRFEGKL